MELAARERELTAKGTNPCPTASWTVKNDAPGLLLARTSLICATQYNQREQTRTKKGWADCQRLASSCLVKPAFEVGVHKQRSVVYVGPFSSQDGVDCDTTMLSVPLT